MDLQSRNIHRGDPNQLKVVRPIGERPGLRFLLCCFGKSEEDMPGFGRDLPQPRWAARKGPTVAVSQSSASILVTHATDARRVLRVFDLNNPEKSNATEVSVSIIDCATGATKSLPPFICPDDAGQPFILDGTLHVNCGESILRWESAKSDWKTLVRRANHQLQSPVVSLAGSIYALWLIPEGDSEGQGLRFSKTAKNGTVWGPCFGPDAYVYEANWQIYRGELLVRCQVGGLSRVDPATPTMFRVSADSLRVKAEIAVGLTGKMLIANDQLFCDGMVDFGELASPRKQFFRDDAGRQLAELTVTEMSGYIPSQSTFLSCYDLPTLRLRKRWRIWNGAQSLTIAPERKGILVTHSGAEGAVRLLSSRTPGPMLVGPIFGLAIGDPVHVGRQVFWLCHLGATSEYYALHDSWPTIQAQIESKKSEVSTVVDWFDDKSQKWRRASARPEYEPTYILTALDTDTGDWRAQELTLHEPIYTLLAHDDDLVFVGWSDIRSLSVTSLLQTCLPLGKIPKILGDPLSADVPIVQGLPLTGPITDDWGFRSASPVGLQLLKKTYTPADFARLEKDSDLRVRALDDLVARTVEGVNGSWPDIGRLALRKCPSTLSREYSSNVDNVERTPFGGLEIETSFVAHLVDWCRTLNEEAERKLPSKEVALLTARFLLHEYIRRLKNGVWRDYEKPQVDVPTSGPYQELLGWYNLGLVDQTPNRDEILSALRTRTKSLFQRSPKGESATQDKGPTSLDIVRLHEEWPDGCPPLIQDVDSRLAYLRYCLEVAGLIAPHRRSRLQAAVARSWQNPLVRGGKQVFISYSHSTPKPAQLIADGLRHRGLGVALDVHELPGDAQEWDVETWIAENIVACDVVVYVMSTNFVASGWINRETDWEHRLYGVKPAVILPYLVLTDRELELRSYPRSRICSAFDVETPEQFETILSELAVRISFDLAHALLGDQRPFVQSLS